MDFGILNHYLDTPLEVPGEAFYWHRTVEAVVSAREALQQRDLMQARIDEAPTAVASAEDVRDRAQVEYILSQVLRRMELNNCHYKPSPCRPYDREIDPLDWLRMIYMLSRKFVDENWSELDWKGDVVEIAALAIQALHWHYERKRTNRSFFPKEGNRGRRCVRLQDHLPEMQHIPLAKFTVRMHVHDGSIQ